MATISNETLEMANLRLFKFEETFDHTGTQDWVTENWTLTFYSAAVYVIFIHYGRHYMNSRTKFDLRNLLFIWNFLLAAFSIVGTSRTAMELWTDIRLFGLQTTFCNTSFFPYSKITSFWGWYFLLSKIVEFGDTVFIILRKQPLIFLHWYHHITVLLYTWYAVAEKAAPGRWFMVINFTVHSMMYTYYTLRALKIQMPRPVSMFITAAQLSQMVIGLYINVSVYRIKLAGNECRVSDNNIKASFLMYFSYFVLFLNFFLQTYCRNVRSSQRKIKPN